MSPKSTRSRQYASLDWSAVQTLFESTISDVLLLLDCCSAASSAPKGGTALTETIAACGWESIAAEPGRFSFTSALIEVLDEWIKRTFSVAMLHSKVLSVLKHERPELLGGTQRVECRRTPVYIVTTENHQAPSITLSHMKPPTLSKRAAHSSFESGRQTPELESVRRTKRRRKSEVEKEPMLSNNTTDVDQASVSSELTEASPLPEEYDLKLLDATMPDGNLRLPHVLISIALDEDQILNVTDCSEWFASFPALAQYARVQSVYRSYSTLLIISLPVVLWDLLPEEPACNFIGYVMSEDFLTKGARSQGKHRFSTIGDLATSPIQNPPKLPVWQSEGSNADINIVPTSGPTSRLPSISSSPSTRSLSPSSGNSMRFPRIPFPPPRTPADRSRRNTPWNQQKNSDFKR